MSKAFVLNAGSRSSLPVLESLHRNGVETVIAGPERISCGPFSRYADQYVRIPRLFPPWDIPSAVIVALEKQLQKYNPDVLFPLQDSSAQAISRHRDLLSKYTAIPVAPFRIWDAVSDKLKFMEAARKLGASIPPTYTPAQALKRAQRSPPTKEHPWLVKPCYSSGARGIIEVHSLDELRRTLALVKEYWGPVHVQERIPSKRKISVNVLLNKDQKLRASCSFDQFRSFPAKDGTSIYSVTKQYPKLIKKGADILANMGFWGVSDLDYIVDERDGKPYLMEANPRFWGSIRLSVASGVDFPYLLHRMMLDGDVKTVSSFKEGLVLREFVGEINWLFHKKEGWPKGQLFHFGKGVYWNGTSWKDPMASVGFALQGLRRVLDVKRRSEIFNTWKEAKT